MASRRWLAYAALVLAVLGMTWSAIFVRWAGVSGPASAFYRVAVAAVVLLPWRAARRDLAPPSPRAAWLAVAGGVFFGFDLLLYNTGVMKTSAATAVLLGNNAPVLVGLGTWFFFGRRPEAKFWWGLALALGGCAAIVAADAASRGGGVGVGNATGDMLALAAAVFFAAYLMTTERVRARMDTLTFSSLAILGSVVTSLVVCLVLRVPLSGYAPRSWASLVGLGLVSQLAAYFAIVYALGHLPATVMSVGFLAQLPLTALLSVPLLGESVTAIQIGGGLLVLAGIYVVNRPPATGAGRTPRMRRGSR
jgi:drug/metabolite transporter (DMT)-like permease